MPLDGVPLRVTSIERRDAGDVSAGQPLVWTFVEFEAREEQADALAAALTAVLDERLGWYCDFRSSEETFVVFAGRAFRYRRGDREARAEVEAYGRAAGVPESQLDWPE
jgi:hypothetical protein